MGQLDGKRVIVTGGAGGIGAAAVIACRAAGATVACTYNATVPSLPDGVLSRRCDIASKAEIDTAFDGFAAAMGGIDVLIHAAGIHGACAADQLTEGEWDRMFALNGKATMFTNQAAFRHMQGHGARSSIWARSRGCAASPAMPAMRPAAAP